MTVHQIIEELRRRDVHVRQYFDARCFELPIDVEHAVRKLLGITNEQGVEVEQELNRRAGVS